MGRIKGYTMIELIIVLALFALLLSISYPTLGIVNNYKEFQELKEFKRDVLFARNQAIVNNKVYSCIIDYPNNGYIINTEGKNIKKYNFQYGVKLIDNAGAVRLFTFGGNGVPLKTGIIRVDLDSKNNYYYLTVTPVIGKISLKEVRD